jgi:5-phospho-D-xylono-1,4-lactonase
VTGVVRTVLGDVPAAELGPTYAHEHLILDNALIEAAFPHIHLPDVDAAAREVGTCAEAGVRAMVDAMPCAAGRDVVRLAEVSRRTGVHIVAATGLHHRRYYGPTHWSARVQPDELGRLFAEDVLLGVDAFDYTGPLVRRTGHRAGLIKIATGGERLDARDRLLVTAAGLAHRASGAPVLTHCEGGRGGIEQIAALERAGVPPDAVVLSHVDKVVDPGYHRELVASGATVEYDQTLRRASDPEHATIGLITALLAAGCGDRIVLGTDGARRDLWAAFGGAPGLAWLATGFRERLAAAGVGETDLRRLYVENPAGVLALRPADPGVLGLGA